MAGLNDDNPEGLEYPYTCPKCGRQFKTTISLEVHLESFDHNNPPEDYDPCNPEWKPKKRDERLKELSLKTDSAPNSPRPMQTPTQPKGRPPKTPGSRGGRKSFGSHRKRKVLEIVTVCYSYTNVLLLLMQICYPYAHI